MRTMYDSTTAADIPANAQMVAGYVDGRYKWSDADWARFPHAVKVRIATQATTNDGTVGDVEWGDMTPEQSVDWVLMRRAAGADPTIYVNRANYQQIIKVFALRRVAFPYFWLSTLDNQPTLDEGFVANQYAGQRHTGKHYDLSIVRDFWHGVDSIKPTRGENHMESYTLVSGEHVFIPGVNKDTSWNVVSQDFDATVTIFLYQVDGTPIASDALPRVIKGNLVDVHGPEQIFGTFSNIPDPGGTAYFKNEESGGAATIVVMVHRG